MKILVMRDGTEYAVKCRRGKYWICEGTQFRVSNPAILEIREDAPKAKKNEKTKKGDV